MKRDYLNYLKWTEPIALFLELPEITERKALDIVRIALDVDLQLGASLAGRARSEFREQMTELLLKLDIAETIKIALLKNIHSDHAFEVLCNLLNDKNLRSLATQALGRIANPLAVSPLIELLSGTEIPNIRELAADALGKIRNEASVPALIKSLNDQRVSRLRTSLKEKTYEEFVDVELRGLNTGEYFLRENSARALGEIGTPAAEEALLNALEEPQSYVLAEVAYALAAIESEAAIDACIQSLHDNGNFEQENVFYDIFNCIAIAWVWIMIVCWVVIIPFHLSPPTLTKTEDIFPVIERAINCEVCTVFPCFPTASAIALILGAFSCFRQ